MIALCHLTRVFQSVHSLRQRTRSKNFDLETKLYFMMQLHAESRLTPCVDPLTTRGYKLISQKEVVGWESPTPVHNRSTHVLCDAQFSHQWGPNIVV